MRKVTIILMAFMSLFLFGCSKSTKEPSKQNENPANKDNKQVQIVKEGDTQKPSTTQNSNTTPNTTTTPSTTGSQTTPGGAVKPPASSESTTITKEKAIELVKDFMKKNESYIPSKVEVDSETNEIYTIHAYDVVENHTATVGWYTVNKTTGKVESMF